jgi:hypothetical protein
MKIKVGIKNKEYYAGIYTGSGGVSSLVNYRQGKKLLYVLGVFKLKNLWVGLIGKRTQ